MTLFISFRTSAVNGGNANPSEALDLASPDGPLAFTRVSFAELSQRAAGRDVLFATHGFNVHMEPGARSLARLEAQIAPTGQELFISILWPGDWWLPAVNYPFAGSPAMMAGKRLGAICNQWLTDAASLSFVSHSLGARVILEAAQGNTRKARVVCLTAAAVNRDALAAQYSQAQKNADNISNLASEKDNVLKLAFPIGDLFANLLHDDHEFLKAALGRRGPARPIPANVRPSQIPETSGYDHSNYLPPGDPVPDANADKRWIEAANFMARAFRQQPQPWPRPDG